MEQIRLEMEIWNWNLDKLGNLLEKFLLSL